MNKERILVTGSEGMLGSYIDFGIRFTKQTLDITDLDAVTAACLKHRPSVIVHLAGLTDLALCEREPARAYHVNTVGTYYMALAARAVGAKLVFLSTSGVFDGTKKGPYTEDDIPNPINVYGHSKYLAEAAIATLLDNYLIVRTSWLFGGGSMGDKKFVGKILAQRKSAEVRAVKDRHGSPTYAKDLTKALEQLIVENKRGVVHISGGTATRYDVALEALKLIGSDAKIIPTSPTDFVDSYKSGVNESVPDSPYLRPWREALAEYIRTEWDNTPPVAI